MKKSGITCKALFILLVLLIVGVSMVNVNAVVNPYNIYFGDFHAHTGYSDGQGTPDAAFAHAKSSGRGDFFTVSDHSSALNETEWTDIKNKANLYNDSTFVAYAAWEETCNWGHMNALNVDWLYSDGTMLDFYNQLVSDPNAIGQWNHPLWNNDDFDNFANYSVAYDDRIELLEVLNPTCGGTSYAEPSYQKALDVGWHVSPSTNSDTHDANWLDNEERTAVLAMTLTRASIFDAVRNHRVYATENRNLRVYFEVNGAVMGSVLANPGVFNFDINVQDPDTAVPEDKIVKIDIITGGGVIAATSDFNAYTVDWAPTITSSNAKYFYLRVTNAAGKFAWTSPVWTGSPAPGAPPLFRPRNGETRVSKTPLLTWIGSADAQTYRVVVSTTSDFSTPVIDQSGITGTTYQATTTLGGRRTFYWKVIAQNAYGSTPSGVFSFETSSPGDDTTPPTAPSNLTATPVSSSQINLSWTASTDSGGIGGYQIFRGGAQAGTSFGTAYSDTGLAPNTAYSYYVKAYDVSGNISGASNTAQATTYGGGTPPPSPSASPSPSPSVSPSASPSPSPSVSPSPSASPSSSPSPSPSPSASPSPSPSSSPGANLALNKTATVSSYHTTTTTGAQAVDGDLVTYWRSLKKSTLPVEWIVVDLGASYTIDTVTLKWGACYATTYQIQTSPDNNNWTTVYTTSSGNGATDEISFSAVSARYVRMYSTAWNNGAERCYLQEYEIYQ